MAFKVTQQDANTLSTEYKANYIPIIVVAGIAAFLTLLSMTGNLKLLGIAAVLFLISFISFIQEKSCSCTIDKSTGTIRYQEQGLADSPVETYKFDDLFALEMKRHRSRGSDRFELRLALPSKTLSLTGKSLDFAECQTLAKRIHHFLGRNIMLDAID